VFSMSSPATATFSVDFQWMGESYKQTTTSRGEGEESYGTMRRRAGTTMNTRILIAILSLGLFTAWPSTATPPHTAIIIDSGSPYFVPKSATVSSGASIRWDNPTATDHTITHVDCLHEGNTCAFDSGIIRPSGNFALSGLAPGQYPYLCRIHPIMYGIVTVTDSMAPSPSQL
jgi:plastocyanin